jgi:two-component system, chemotaxis family, chemotaxis protein CheY
MTVILHVEDDTALGSLVSLSLEGLGFRGLIVPADTVHKAETLLDEAAQDGQRFDLILSDMNLPDGSGLELVRYVRASATWKTTPMLILSGDENPKTVNRAYALGANAYVSKSPPGRNLSQVVNALYHHWIKDVVPQGTKIPNDIEDAFTRAITIRLRHARLYERIAGKFADNSSEAAFWLSRSLAESNLINVLGFVQAQLRCHDIDDDVSEIEEMQNDTQRALSALELELDRSNMSRDDIYLRVLQLVTVPNIDLVARSLGRLFPVIPMAVATLREFMLGSIEDLVAWIDLHTSVPAIRERASQLRDATVSRRDDD